jgi:hypothetical protein
MRFLVIALLLLKSMFCFAQDDTTIVDNYFCVKTSPLAFIDPWGGYSYRLGAEWKLIGNTAFSFEAGQYYSLGGKFDLKHHTKGFIFRPEFKVYFNKLGSTTGPYISLDAFYKKIDFGYKDSIRIDPNPPYEKLYNIWKKVYSINVRYGEMEVIKNAVVFEWFIGGGIRVINGRNDLSTEENEHVLTGENHGSEIGMGQRAITGIFPNITFGIKIGYSFSSKVKRFAAVTHPVNSPWGR